jgi:hypothetical protein
VLPTLAQTWRRGTGESGGTGGSRSRPIETLKGPDGKDLGDYAGRLELTRKEFNRAGGAARVSAFPGARRIMWASPRITKPGPGHAALRLRTDESAKMKPENA